jgi:hypothetical protein
MAGPVKSRHPREQVFCLECGKEILAGAYREFVITMENCCGTELVALCSKECWDKYLKSRGPDTRPDKG